jgi:uncharacterized damage-inducible protein DinB
MSALQDYLATAIPKAADDLTTAFLRLPEEKRAWSPMGDARTALDQMAECAILNGSVAELMVARKWPEDMDMAEYERNKAELAKDWPAVKALLEANTAKAVATIKTIADADLSLSVDMPWGPMTVSQIMGYPFWNMAYHEGQINFMASMLGVLP